MSADDESSPVQRQAAVASLTGVEVNLTCYGFYIWAKDFLAAEQAYAPDARQGSFVAHFLCCQSVELSLKAFLSLKGMTRDRLRREFGHNLGKLFDEACRQGIAAVVAVQPTDAAALDDATAWYDSPGGKRLQYFGLVDALMGFRHAPDLVGLEDVAMRLQSSALHDAVLKA